MNINILSNTIREYAALKEEKARLADAAKENNAAIADMEKKLTEGMLDMAEHAGIDDPSMFAVEVDGRKYSMAVKSFYSIRAADRDRAFSILRDVGLGDLIQMKVDDRTLTKTLAQLASENDGELPEQYAELPLTTYEKTTINDRKVGK